VELGAETAEGRGSDRACISEEEGRGRGSVEGRFVGDTVARLRPLGGDGASTSGRWPS
jgi:hypothetical protein